MAAELRLYPRGNSRVRIRRYQHSYLVYRDGMGNAEVIWGGANWSGFASEVELEIGKPLARIIHERWFDNSDRVIRTGFR